jgi:hypothetical protein
VSLDRCNAADGVLACTKDAPHPGERHEADFGAGTYTWGYELTADEAAQLADAQRETRGAAS